MLKVECDVVMAKKSSGTLRCPTCRTLVVKGDEHFPFCSDRCRLIDLGAWLTEQHKIPDEAGTAEDQLPPGSAEES